ncbi:MAG: hypothetical protein AMXMBFR77_28050 [Phycisphaerales bacterium]
MERFDKADADRSAEKRTARLELMRAAGILPAFEKFVPDDFDPRTDEGRAAAQKWKTDHAQAFRQQGDPSFVRTPGGADEVAGKPPTPSLGQRVVSRLFKPRGESA